MRFTVTKTIILNKAERDVLKRFESMIDEMNLNADEIEQLLFDVYRDKTHSAGSDILINYVDD
jgi:hypothetical protein